MMFNVSLFVCKAVIVCVVRKVLSSYVVYVREKVPYVIDFVLRRI